jgi:hypothetical protein
LVLLRVERDDKLFVLGALGELHLFFFIII